MENKYYKPERSEFHIGFEYEQQEGEDGIVFEYSPWVKKVFYDLAILMSHPRVKYLDSEDISSLGWKELTDVWVLESGRRLLNLGYYDEDKTQMYIDDHQTKVSYFIGYIKNKSELKKLMQMIGII